MFTRGLLRENSSPTIARNRRAFGCTRVLLAQCPSASTSAAPSAPRRSEGIGVRSRVSLRRQRLRDHRDRCTAGCSRPATTSIGWSARRSGSACGPRRAPRSRARHRRDDRGGRQSRVARAGDPDPRRRQAGSGPGVSCDDTPLVVIAFPLGAPTPEMYEKGVAVAIVSITRNSPRAIDPAVKSGNYLNNVLALGEARRRSGAYEAILCARRRQHRRGVDQQHLRGRRRRGADAAARGRHPRRHHARQGPGARPRRTASRSSSGASRPTSCAAPTRRSSPAPRAASCRSPTIDEKPVGAGVPGPVTRKLMALYDALARGGSVEVMTRRRRAAAEVLRRSAASS